MLRSSKSRETLNSNYTSLLSRGAGVRVECVCTRKQANDLCVSSFSKTPSQRKPPDSRASCTHNTESAVNLPATEKQCKKLTPTPQAGLNLSKGSLLLPGKTYIPT